MILKLLTRGLSFLIIFTIFPGKGIENINMWTIICRENNVEISFFMAFARYIDSTRVYTVVIVMVNSTVSVPEL